MPFKKIVYPAFVLSLFIFSCSKKQSPSVTPPPVKPFITDVYTVGNKIVSNEPTGIFWTNGVQDTITADNRSSLNGLVMVGTDLYIAGYTSVGATYWKNGFLSYLDQLGASSAANSIAVSGNDVYIGGWAIKAGDAHSRAVYWKNGIEEDLTDGKTESVVNAIAISGTDVYAIGQNNQPDFNNVAGASTAACWKNGTMIPLENAVGVAGTNSFAKGLAMSGNDVYVAGYINFGAVLWKNGNLQPLDNNSGSPYGSAAFTVAVNVSDVYVGGEYGNAAAYWKNDKIMNLTTGFVNSQVQCICFNNSDVYMGGFVASAPTYWKNDTAHTMQNNGAPYSVNGITVSMHQ